MVQRLSETYSDIENDLIVVDPDGFEPSQVAVSLSGHWYVK